MHDDEHLLRRVGRVLLADPEPPQAAPDEGEVRAVHLLERHPDPSRTGMARLGRAIANHSVMHDP